MFAVEQIKRMYYDGQDTVSTYPSDTTHYTARVGLRGASNVSRIITRWFYYNVTESPRFKFAAPFAALSEPEHLRDTLTSILEGNSAEWDHGATVDFWFTFLQDNCVMVNIGRLRIQVTVCPDCPFGPADVYWYTECNPTLPAKLCVPRLSRISK